MNTIFAGSATEWRRWLEQHGRSEKEVWLVIQHKNSGTTGPGSRCPTDLTLT